MNLPNRMACKRSLRGSYTGAGAGAELLVITSPWGADISGGGGGGAGILAGGGGGGGGTCNGEYTNLIRFDVILHSGKFCGSNVLWIS